MPAFTSWDWVLVALLWLGVGCFIGACHLYLKALKREINRLIASSHRLYQNAKSIHHESDDEQRIHH